MQLREVGTLTNNALISDSSRSAMFSDAAQPRLFGKDPNYLNKSSAASRPVLASLPNRFGYEVCIIHTAESAAMVASLRWRSDCVWNIFLGDRNALFTVLQHASDTNAPWHSEGACLPAKGRLRRILCMLKE